jgi:hypothetical protein
LWKAVTTALTLTFVPLLIFTTTTSFAADKAASAPPSASRADSTEWAAAGSADTELGVLMEPEVGHGTTEIYTGVQA